MYRQGLGDCFLVTFDPGGREVHMLIDCGTLGAKSTNVKLSTVVANIREITGNHLHLLIATHEHQDHVSGFRSLKEEFEQMTVDHVWLAWTENPKDKLAQKIQKYKGDLGVALAAAAMALASMPGRDEKSRSMGLAIQSLLGFAGGAEEPEAPGMALDADKKEGLAKTIDEAMDVVRSGLGAKTRYLTPGGAAIEEDWVPGFRFYVLGPPRSEAKLGELGDHGSAELYGMAAALGAGAAGEMTAAAFGGSPENEMPFDCRYRRTETQVRPHLECYFEEDASWRRVDNDWLHSAADLALQLDSMTNNTSLALAIERISDGKVLLFPADAQQGHWLSWHDPEMKLTYTPAGRTPVDKTAEELLNNTVFYKVGHHSSHNATARGKGLEMMTRSDDLVAFIPVDRKVALGRNPKDSWQMPAHDLYRRLLEKCQGRVARSDLGWADDAANAEDKDVEKAFLELGTAAEWTKWKSFQKKAGDALTVVVEDLFIDFRLA